MDEEGPRGGNVVNNFTLGHLIHWFTTAAHWSGPDGIPNRVFEHVLISVESVTIAAAIALPVGMYVGHRRKGEFIAVTTANVGRAVPSFALLVLVFTIMLRILPANLAYGFGPGVVTLTLLGIPPILTNTIVGIQGVDADTVEAARGMGFREREVLSRLELPLAMPLIMGGVRTAALQIVATATLIALIGGGGLGTYIVGGIAQSDTVQTIAGAALVALLALFTEFGLALVERRVTPRHTRTPRRWRRIQPAAGIAPPTPVGL
ncbi:MAG TPA: ABC transporter permease [Actinomycetota bacterium]|nr:ABC transporter permease [Actinomycetota bacterium]